MQSCCICGTENNLTIHHVVPRIVLSCIKYNSPFGKNIPSWLTKSKGRGPERRKRNCGHSKYLECMCKKCHREYEKYHAKYITESIFNTKNTWNLHEKIPETIQFITLDELLKEYRRDFRLFQRKKSFESNKKFLDMLQENKIETIEENKNV